MSTSSITSVIEESIAAHKLETAAVRLGEALSVMYPDETACLVFDGPNFQHTAKALGLNIEYSSLFDTLRSVTRLRSIHYFVGLSDDPHHASARNQVTWMRNHGVRVHTRVSQKSVDPDGVARWKANMDVEIAVATLTQCDKVDTVILATGDGDFVPLVKALQARGQRVLLMSSEKTPEKQLSDQLRTCVDGFIEVDDFEGTCATRVAEPV